MLRLFKYVSGILIGVLLWGCVFHYREIMYSMYLPVSLYRDSDVMMYVIKIIPKEEDVIEKEGVMLQTTNGGPLAFFGLKKGDPRNLTIYGEYSIRNSSCLSLMYDKGVLYDIAAYTQKPDLIISMLYNHDEGPNRVFYCNHSDMENSDLLSDIDADGLFDFRLAKGVKRSEGTYIRISTKWQKAKMKRQETEIRLQEIDKSDITKFEAIINERHYKFVEGNWRDSND